MPKLRKPFPCLLLNGKNTIINYAPHLNCQELIQQFKWSEVHNIGLVGVFNIPLKVKIEMFKEQFLNPQKNTPGNDSN